MENALRRNGAGTWFPAFPPMRNRGLASACGAALILECLERGLYPSWDAHTEISAALAEKLGYHVSHPYVVYEVEADKGPV